MALGSTFLRLLSRVDHWPGLASLTPPLAQAPNDADLRGFARAQRLAIECAEATERGLSTGVSERQIARQMRRWLADRGVEHYFHHPFVWFGPRTQFRHFTSRNDLRATDQTLAENDVYVFDFAPIVEGYACDFSHAGQWGTVPGYTRARAVLDDIYQKIPSWVTAEGRRADRLWGRVHHELAGHGLGGVHETSWYSFLGHRVQHVARSPLARQIARRGQPAFFELFARGGAGQVLSRVHQGEMTGLWAIEPHVAFDDHAVKFEELLLVTPSGVSWLRDLPAA